MYVLEFIFFYKINYFFLKDFIDDKVKQNIAAQFNLSETVFLSAIIDEESSDNRIWNIRWFTPKTEVELCGHATLAASFILATNENLNVIKYKSKFHKKLEAIFDPTDQTIMLNFPMNRCERIDINTPWLPAIKQAVVGQENMDRIVDVQLSTGTKKLLIRLSDDNSDEFLVKIRPNFKQLLQIDTKYSVKGIIVTQKPLDFNGEKHFSSRYFAPWVGIQEDPVTGSAHTGLFFLIWLKITIIMNQLISFYTILG